MTSRILVASLAVLCLVTQWGCCGYPKTLRLSGGRVVPVDLAEHLPRALRAADDASCPVRFDGVYVLRRDDKGAGVVEVLRFWPAGRAMWTPASGIGDVSRVIEQRYATKPSDYGVHCGYYTWDDHGFVDMAFLVNAGDHREYLKIAGVIGADGALILTGEDMYECRAELRWRLNPEIGWRRLSLRYGFLPLDGLRTQPDW